MLRLWFLSYSKAMSWILMLFQTHNNNNGFVERTCLCDILRVRAFCSKFDFDDHMFCPGPVTPSSNSLAATSAPRMSHFILFTKIEG